jgi:hypothetical protein
MQVNHFFAGMYPIFATPMKRSRRPLDRRKEMGQRLGLTLGERLEAGVEYK